mmetsp:Transcript_24759/g.36975  ORF Transcript_24759/g.36975 Transcript_24759/m.36975 type:complete len:248 (+) Transcript_24759:268-1011(+)
MSTNTNTITKKKKTLSGATMGMRFMQRRITDAGNTNSNTSSSLSSSTNATRQLHESNGSGGGTDDNRSGCTNSVSTGVAKIRNENEWEMDTTSNNSNGPAAMDIDTNPLIHQSSSSPYKNYSAFGSSIGGDCDGKQIPLFEIATKTDMYGISSEIIGRRSFNNFNKPVQETYQAAIHARRRDKIDKKVEKEQISDEELLKRYEKYVKGRGDMSSSSSSPMKNRAVNKDVGNLKAKVAKKRKREKGIN